MTAGFVGRTSELALLDKRLARVTASGAGTALAVRGQRQVGKSRLAQEFCDRAGVPYLFYTATKGASPVEAITAFLAELSNSSVPRDPGLVPAEPIASWPDAFRVLAAVLPDSPVVIVLDELPWLACLALASPTQRPPTSHFAGFRRTSSVRSPKRRGGRRRQPGVHARQLQGQARRSERDGRPG